MAVKDALPCSFSVVAGFDNYFRGDDPYGYGPLGYLTSTRLLYTDVRHASLANGENGLGSYLNLFGYNFGTKAALGTASGARVYLRDPLGDNAWHEVANYRSLGTSVTFTKTQIQRLAVQVGALGGGITAGRVLDLYVSVNGEASNSLNTLTGHITEQVGHFFFVSLSGNDGTGVKNDISLPFRYLQQANGGTTFTGVWDPTTGVKAGDTIVLRGGSWSDQVGFETKWFRAQSHTGSAPNGSANNGPITITSYPGPILGNAPEVVQFTTPASGAGAIMGCSSARSALGYGKYFNVCNLKIAVNATAATDAGPINFQTNADYWRVVNCELGPWPSTLVSPANAKAGGIAGSSVGGKILGNYIHDIDCDANNPGTSALENHGIYFDTGQTTPSADVEVAYNVIEDILGGSGIQFQDTNGGPNTGMLVHHNWIDTCIKYGINLAVGLVSLNVYNNVFRGCGRNTLRWGGLDSVSTTDINITHNTIFQPLSTSAYKTAITRESNVMTLGSIKIQHNIVVLEVGASAGSTDYHDITAGETNCTVSENLYFDRSGTETTVPAKDTLSAYGDPLFTDYAALNFTVATGSPALGACTAAEAIAVADDFYGVARPVTGTGAPGATKNDIGAMQGVGT